MQVLIVDGAEELDDVRAAVEREGAVVEASSPGAALARADDADVVAAPASLSEGDASTFLERVRRETAATPVLLLDSTDPAALNRADVPALYLDESTCEEVASRLGDIAADRTLDASRSRHAELDRTVRSALARLATGAADDASVCESLIEADAVTAAWLCEYDANRDVLVPRTAAGIDAARLAPADPVETDDVTVADDGTVTVPLTNGSPPHDALQVATTGSIAGGTRDVLADLGVALAARTPSDARVETFSRVFSHELRNHLQAAQSYLGLISADDEHLGHVEDALGRIDRLADLAAVVANGDLNADSLDACDLGACTEAAWESISAPSTSLSATNGATISAKRPLLIALLENLFRNSIRHGDADEIRVGGLSEGFFVEDTGDGVSEADRERAFEFGFTTSAEGSGVGLALVDRIARAHDWSASLTNGDEGGARLEFRGVEEA